MTQRSINTVQEKRTIIVNGYAREDITREQLAIWAPNLTYVSYCSYGFTPEGDLIPLDDEQLIQIAFSSGVAPLMVLNPFDQNGEYQYEAVESVLTNPVVRDRLTNNIVLTVMEKNYYGVIFNFGYIPIRNKESFVVTIAKVSTRLNRGGTMAIVSLVPGVNDAGIDYRGLGRAANFLELRTSYRDQAYERTSERSPMERIRDALDNVTAEVDSRSILLALCVPVEHDASVQAPKYFHTAPSGTEHVVWLENESSIGIKLDLVDEFELAGISIYTIMGPFPALREGIQQRFSVFKV